MRPGHAERGIAMSLKAALAVPVGDAVADEDQATRCVVAHRAGAVATGLETLGLRLVAAPPDRSATVTAAWLPDGLEWAPFNADMRGRGLVIAGGQGKWSGRIFRFGHMGEVGVDEMAEAVRILGETLPAHGFDADAGSAAAATREAFEAAAAPAR